MVDLLRGISANSRVARHPEAVHIRLSDKDRVVRKRARDKSGGRQFFITFFKKY